MPDRFTEVDPQSDGADCICFRRVKRVLESELVRGVKKLRSALLMTLTGLISGVFLVVIGAQIFTPTTTSDKYINPNSYKNSDVDYGQRNFKS